MKYLFYTRDLTIFKKINMNKKMKKKGGEKM